MSAASRRGRRGPPKGQGGRPKGTTEETQHVAFRLPVALLEKLDARAVAMRQERPGQTVTRSDALRVLLHKALDSE